MTDMTIVVFPAGWVFLGCLGAAPEKGYSQLDDAKCVRKWGTSAGLGQLAVQGKQRETVLDPAGIVRWKTGTEIIRIAVSAAAAATF